MLISYLAYSSIPEMEAGYSSSEILVDLHQTEWYYIVKDRTLHGH
jgi:hypothetical protein